MSLNVAIETNMLMIASCIIILMSGFFLQVLAMSKVIKRSLRCMNKSSRLKRHHTPILKQLYCFIQYHSMVKKLSELKYLDIQGNRSNDNYIFVPSLSLVDWSEQFRNSFNLRSCYCFFGV